MFWYFLVHFLNYKLFSLLCLLFWCRFGHGYSCSIRFFLFCLFYVDTSQQISFTLKRSNAQLYAIWKESSQWHYKKRGENNKKDMQILLQIHCINLTRKLWKEKKYEWNKKKTRRKRNILNDRNKRRNKRKWSI